MTDIIASNLTGMFGAWAISLMIALAFIAYLIRERNIDHTDRRKDMEDNKELLDKLAEAITVIKTIIEVKL